MTECNKAEFLVSALLDEFPSFTRKFWGIHQILESFVKMFSLYNILFLLSNFPAPNCFVFGTTESPKKFTGVCLLGHSIPIQSMIVGKA